MITLDIARNFLSISQCEPFDRLTDAELLLVAQHSYQRDYSPGEVMLVGGLEAGRLMVVIEGEALAGDQPAPQVFDAQSVLFGLPVRADHIAGPQGAQALSLAKPHLFTIARECPDFIVGLASVAAGGQP